MRRFRGQRGLGRSDLPGDAQSAEEALLGLAVEFRFADRYFVGLEVLTRDVEAPKAGIGLDANLNTLSLRGGMGF